METLPAAVGPFHGIYSGSLSGRRQHRMKGKSKRWQILCGSIVLAAAALMGVVALGGFRKSDPPVPAKAPPDVVPAGPPFFRDMTADSGIQHTFHNGQEAGHLAILESLGGGVALIDYDGDGLLDIVVTGGGYYDGPDKHTIKGHPNRIYKNLGNWKFKDVTQEVGLDQPLFYTHGCAVADYDRDGWPDLLLTGWGRVALFHNVPDAKAPGGRRFVEVTAKSGLGQDRLWSTSAAWADFDGDGYPDLYICHYVDWSFANHPQCHYHDERLKDVCPPKKFKALPHKLYRNNRDGTFTDVSEQAGLNAKYVLEHCKGLGVLAVDINDDRRPDIYVADDTTNKLLFVNRGGMKFEEIGLAAGVTGDDHGYAQGSMGLDAGDYDGSGRPSLWVVNYEHEHHGLYRNVGNEVFTHATQSAGIAAIGQLYVGFGTGFVDVDLDGWEDLIVANGHVIRHPQEAGIEQRPVLLRNLGTGKFADCTAQGGAYFKGLHIGRGMAIGDLDNDGRTDLVISHLNEPVALLRGEGGPDHHWLGIELVGKDHHDLVGTRVTLDVDGRQLTRFVKGGGSYLSASDRRLLFGLGGAERTGTLTVHWSSGEPRDQTWGGLAIDRYHRLVQGGDAKEAPPRY
jgi:hypothetical protein